MSDDYIVTEILSGEQREQLLKMYKNESWSKERKAEEVKIMLENSRIIALINKENNEVIGFARFLSDCIYRAIIYDVIVSMKYRGLGYGRILVNKLLNHDQIRNIERVELYCKDHNVSFYEKFGFKKVSETNFMRKT